MLASNRAIRFFPAVFAEYMATSASRMSSSVDVEGDWASATPTLPHGTTGRPPRVTGSASTSTSRWATASACFDGSAGMEEDGELVTAQSGDDVGLTDTPGQTSCDDDEQLIAHLVPEGVVDHFEVVQIDEDQGRKTVGVADGAKPVGDLVLQQRPVGEPGERVVERLELEPIGKLPSLTEVAES